MQLHSNLIAPLRGWQVRRQMPRTTMQHIAAVLMESRLQTCKAALVTLLLVYTSGVAAAAEARNEQPAARTSPTRPVSTGAPVSGAQADLPHPASPPVLSAEAQRVSQIAVQNGDNEFLMVDKIHGAIILFENGKPIFSGPVLTGASMGDRIPSTLLTSPVTHKLTLEQKVTPAGRFTATPVADPTYGRIWTLNEIHGKDWDIVIHQVYLGFAAEHRDARLHSANAADRRITFGCMNVEHSTIQALTQHLPQKGKVPLYILPNDTSLIAALFPLRDPRSAAKSVTVKVTNDHPR
jgi:hypothetical protein